MLKLISFSALAALTFFPLSAGAASSCGIASWYGHGDGYHGRTAADGSRFNAYGMTTASPVLPLGSKLTVSNPVNGKSIVVRVTDRGPTIPGRVLDLSYGAFAAIENPSKGVAKVCYSLV